MFKTVEHNVTGEEYLTVVNKLKAIGEHEAADELVSLASTSDELEFDIYAESLDTMFLWGDVGDKSLYYWQDKYNKLNEAFPPAHSFTVFPV